MHKKGRQMHVWKAVPIFYAVMYRTKLGLTWMDKIGKKYTRLMRYYGYFGIFVGFAGMILIAILLIQNLIPLFTDPEAPSGAGLVLPVRGSGIFEGVVFFVPIEFWIISIFIIALIHEYSHGVLARTHNIPVKSSGFAFLGVVVPIVPAAFVEPEEKELTKRPINQQLSVFAAGPLANIILAFVLIVLLSFAITPFFSKIVQADGIEITNFIGEDFPAKKAGIQIGEVIKEVDGVNTQYIQNLSEELKSKKPGDIVTLKTDKGSYEIELAEDPENESRAYMGVFLKQSINIKPGIEQKFGAFLPNTLLWFLELIQFLIILNLGIGLFNLLPIGPLDGGRMFHVVLLKFFKKEVALNIFTKVSLFLFLVVILNLTVPIARNIISALS